MLIPGFESFQECVYYIIQLAFAILTCECIPWPESTKFSRSTEIVINDVSVWNREFAKSIFHYLTAGDRENTTQNEKDFLKPLRTSFSLLEGQITIHWHEIIDTRGNSICEGIVRLPSNQRIHYKPRSFQGDNREYFWHTYRVYESADYEKHYRRLKEEVYSKICFDAPFICSCGDPRRLYRAVGSVLAEEAKLENKEKEICDLLVYLNELPLSSDRFFKIFLIDGWLEKGFIIETEAPSPEVDSQEKIHHLEQEISRKFPQSTVRSQEGKLIIKIL